MYSFWFLQQLQMYLPENFATACIKYMFANFELYSPSFLDVYDDILKFAHLNVPYVCIDYERQNS